MSVLTAEGVVKGTKVKCVDDEFLEDYSQPFKIHEINLPKKGAIYTVRQVMKGFNGEVGVILDEVVNRKFHYAFSVGSQEQEPMFGLRRFVLV